MMRRDEHAPRRRDEPTLAGLAERIARDAAPALEVLARRARRRTLAALAVLLALPAALAAWQWSLAAGEPLPAPRTDARWLAQRVGPDGRFAGAGESLVSEVGLHSLALLALLRGDAAEVPRAALSRAADWLLDQQASDGALAAADADHALGTLALVEAWRATHEPRLRDGAERAQRNLLQREAWGGHGGELAAAWSLEALLTAREAGLDGAEAAEARTRDRLLAALGGPVDRDGLRRAALSPQSVPRQAGLGELYVASVSLLASALGEGGGH
jgi:hypothetical protein